MEQAPQAYKNRNLIHILIGKVEDDPDIELRSITHYLANLMVARANGDKELIHAVQAARKAGTPQKRREVENKGRSQKRRKR